MEELREKSSRLASYSCSYVYVAVLTCINISININNSTRRVSLDDCDDALLTLVFMNNRVAHTKVQLVIIFVGVC